MKTLGALLVLLLLLPLNVVGQPWCADGLSDDETEMSAVDMTDGDLIVCGQLVGHGINPSADICPPALKQLLRGTCRAAANGSQRKKVIRRVARRRVVPKVVPPLLGSIRDQGEPYNALCPRWTYDDGRVSEKRCATGCVAVSIEQIMAYYRYPVELVDTLFGWKTGNYEIEDMLPGTRFDWDNYLIDYRQGWTEAQAMAIALPTLAAGMAVHMNYGLNSSGANLFRGVPSLRRALGYGMAVCRDRALYTPARWHDMLRHELEEGRPIAYAGHNMALSGHAFNIDGVDAQGFYHVNWGYNGAYDGWYDLDWLNPWEPVDTVGTGIAEGLFCNQSALLMHPSPDVEPLSPDTLSLADLGVALDSVRFQRQPDTQGYVPADFFFHNEGKDSVTYTFEVITYLPTDTLIFYQADYVGLSSILLAPGQQRMQRLYLQFAEDGERLLGISNDDETIPFVMPVSVGKGTSPRLEWGSVYYSTRRADDVSRGLEATFSIEVANTAVAGVAGSLVTFCLKADGEEEDYRHYEVLNLPAGERTVLSVTFRDLRPQTAYTFLVRCPWSPVGEVRFTSGIADGIEHCLPTTTEERNVTNKRMNVFDLSGRRVDSDRLRKGIYLKEGKLWLKR